MLLILWTKLRILSGVQRQVSIAASALGFLSTAALSLLSFQDHRKSLRPSTLISIYLLLSIVFDAVQCRTLFLLTSADGLHTIAAVLSANLAVKVVVLLLEVKQKRNVLVPTWRSVPRETLSGVISRSLFWWLNDLLKRGFKSNLRLEILWPTNQSMDSEGLLDKLSGIWGRGKLREGKYALVRATMRSLRWPFLMGGFPRLCLIGFKFSQPLLIQRVVDFVGEKGGEERRDIGYGLIGAAALIYIGLAVSFATISWILKYTLTMTRYPMELTTTEMHASSLWPADLWCP